MALRLCKGTYIINDVDNIDYSYFNNSNHKIIILKKNNNLYGYTTKDKLIYRDFLELKYCFKTGHELLKKNNIEYIRVIENKQIVGFCYDDNYLDDALNKIIDLITFKPEIKSKYSNAIIYGYNELAFYLEKLFQTYNIDYEVRDVLFGNNQKVNKDNKTLEIFVEGNSGLSLDNYSIWKVCHEWLYNYLKPIYDIYNEVSTFKYSDDKIVSDYIKNDKPFMMARIGNTELWIVKQYLQKKMHLIDNYKTFWLDYFFSTSGFFAKNNNLDDVDKYAKYHIEAIKNCDFNLCYGNDELAEGLNIVLQNLQENPINYNWENLSNPFISSWFKLFKNKKILVISPYSKSINNQIKNINKLYDNIYPDMEVITYQCLETQLNNTNGYDSFFDALESMKNDIENIEFDIALICCGAYGYLLSSIIKNMGKSAIELCSYLPNWFGIKIKRYCTNLSINKYWNSNWIFPIENPIKNAEKIEDSCYWE